MSEDSLSIDYEINIVGLDQAKAALASMKDQADKTKNAVNEAKTTANSVVPLVYNMAAAVTNARQIIRQFKEAVETGDLSQLLFALVNIFQLLGNIAAILTIIKSGGIATAIGGAVAAIGGWPVLLLAIAALGLGALIGHYTQQVKSMQTGGPVNDTGLYLLHKGEHVVPAGQVNNRYGSINVFFTDQPRLGYERDLWMETLEDRLEKRARRSG